MIKHKTTTIAAIGLITLSSMLTACSGGASSQADTRWQNATSAEAGGGMQQLVKDAQAEGTFNAMGLFDDWANYGGLLHAFSEKYHIKINNDQSTGASQDLINAIVNRKGQRNSLDYLDTGVSFAIAADKQGLLAKYTPQTINDIPQQNRAQDNSWINQYGGTMAIGCDTSQVAQCPTTMKDLLKPEYKGKVALTGNPGTAETALMAVFAAAMANGGSLDNIKPGIDFFHQLSKEGNFVPVQANQGTVETGATPIIVDWDYLLKPIQQDVEQTEHHRFDIVIPADGKVSSFYAASINADAPHPAVARLFYEFLFSDEGQNLLLKGYVTPVRLKAMIKNGAIDQQALAKLPGKGDISASQPTVQQSNEAASVIKQQWAKAVQ